MNPHLVNARVILPVSTYKRIVQGTPVQYLLYANNYEPVDESHPAVELFTNAEEALSVFSEGKRMAKGTTTEKGLVASYFANPFGAPQRRNQHEELAARIMHTLFNHQVAVGQLRTQLGLPGWEHTGPQTAAEALFQLISQHMR